MAKRFTVTYERDETGWWVADIAAVPGCHTQGRTLAQARTRIREALAACLDDPAQADAAQLADAPRLPARLGSRVRAARAARAKAEAAHAGAQTTLRQAVRALVDAGLSVRDAADLLGISFQRVHQLAHA